jgi:hypothetical protein
MKLRTDLSIFPMAENPRRCTRQFNSFDHLVKNQIDEQKNKLLVSKTMKRRNRLLRNHRISVMNRALCTIAIPIFIWLLLETFFK